VTEPITLDAMDSTRQTGRRGTQDRRRPKSNRHSGPALDRSARWARRAPALWRPGRATDFRSRARPR
jgi:hypothetical protein